MNADGSARRSKFLYDIATWLATILALNYCAASFVLLNLRDSMRFYRDLHFGIHIAVLVGLAAFRLVEAVSPAPKRL